VLVKSCQFIGELPNIRNGNGVLTVVVARFTVVFPILLSLKL
jgi:hypothetical protein